MRRPARTVDDGLTMTSTLLSPEQLVSTATGRFGRQLMTIAHPDPETAPVRTATVTRMQERMRTSDYRIDPRLVSGAIIERLFTGHTL